MKKSRWSSWMNSVASLKNKLSGVSTKPKRSRDLKSRGLHLEPLEERQMLAIITVDSPLGYANDGNSATTTLYEAIAQANSTPEEDDTIVFDLAEFPLESNTTIELHSGRLNVTDNLVIDGLDAGRITIDANRQHRVFAVYSNVTATFSGITITRGSTDWGGDNEYDGGGIYAGSNSIVTINDSVLIYNSAFNSGGAIYAATDSTIIVNNSSIENNNASFGYADVLYANGSKRIEINNSTITGNNSGLMGYDVIYGVDIDEVIKIDHSSIINNGGAITVSNSQIEVINDSTISDNGSFFGCSGISGSNSTIKVSNSTISDNGSDDIMMSGGHGIYANDCEIEVANSTISGHIANGYDSSAMLHGGGIYLAGAVNNSKITNSLIFGNSATSDGGGVYTNITSGTLEVLNSTITDNTALDGGGIYIGNSPATVLSKNSIVTQNTATTTTNPKHDIYGTLAADVENIIGDDPGFVDADGHDYRIAIDSPAVNAGNNLAASGFSNDLDGNDRIIYEVVDIGAYEQSGTILISTQEGGNDGDYTYGDLSVEEAVYLATLNAGDDAILEAYIPVTITSSLNNTNKEDREYAVSIEVPDSVTVASLKIDWGDGNIVSGTIANNWGVDVTYVGEGNGVKIWKAKHVYEDDGSYSIQVQAGDDFPLPASGDINHDGTVDALDLAILIDNWHAGVGNPDPVYITWEMGDVSGDGQIDDTDVAIVVANWQHVAARGEQTANINNIAPRLIINAPKVIDETTAFELGAVSFDPGTDTMTQWRINWGDGSPVSDITGATLSNVAHDYYSTTSAPTNYTIQVEAWDEDNFGEPTGYMSETFEVAVTVGGWQLYESGGTTNPATASMTNGILTLNEGDSLTASLFRNIDLSGTSATIPYTNYSLDVSSSQEWINDAVEFAILGTEGMSLVPTIGAWYDSLFNASEDQSVVLASGVTHDDSSTPKTITVDTSGVPLGTTGQLYVRLANNDQDEGTYVELPHLVIDASGNSTVNEGDDYSLNLASYGYGVEEINSWWVDWDGDGTFDEQFAADTVTATHRYLDGPTTHAIKTKVTFGALDWEVQAPDVNVNVINVPAIVILDVVASINENGTATLTGTVNDPGVLDSILLDINWGDPSSPNNSWLYSLPASPTGTQTFSITHQYLDDNPTATTSDSYTINVTVMDKDYEGGSDSTTVVVHNVAPTVTILGAPASGTEGTLIDNLTVSIVDPGTLDTYGYDWSVTKDGQPYATGNNADFSFTPDDGPGSYVLSVIVTDDDCNIGFNSVTIPVSNVAPVVTLDTVTSIDENGIATLTGIITDPGELDTFTLDINWGDPSSPNNVESYPLSASATGTQAFSYTHQYLDDNPSGTPSDSYTINVTVTDKDNQSGSDSTTVVVGNVAPTVTILGAPANGTEGTLIDNLTVSIVDPGTLDTYDYAWSVTKNGLPYATGNNADFSFTPDDDAASFVLSVTVTDDDGNSGVDSVTIPVNNVAPVVTQVLLSDTVIDEGSSTQVTASFTDVGILDTHTATIDWGDGTSSVGVVDETNGSGTVTGTHVYADDGPYDQYTITVEVTDKDSGVDSDQAIVSVNNVAPTLSANWGYQPIGSGTSAQIQVVITGQFTDPGFTRTEAGTEETFSITIDWNGDGSDVDTFSNADLSVVQGDEGDPTICSFYFAHTFMPGDTYTITLTVEDDDGGLDSVTGEDGFTFAILAMDPENLNLKSTIGVTLKQNAQNWPDYDNVVGSSLRFGPAGALEKDRNIGNQGNLQFYGEETGIADNDDVAFLTGELDTVGNGDPQDYINFIALCDIYIVPGSSQGAPGISPTNTKFFVVDATVYLDDNNRPINTIFGYEDSGTGSGNATVPVYQDESGTPLSSPSGIASAADGTLLWTIDRSTHIVMVLDGQGSGDGLGDLVGQWQALSIVEPVGITTFDTNLWVVDKGTQSVVFFPGPGATSLRAGALGGIQAFSLHASNTSPSDLVTDGNYFWVVDDVADAVFVYDMNGDYMGQWGLDSNNSDATGITLDPTLSTTNYIWTVDNADLLVYEYDVSSLVLDPSTPSGPLTASGSFDLDPNDLNPYLNPQGIADPPVVKVDPVISQIPAGSKIIVSGQVNPDTNPIDQITVNNEVAQVVDAAGNVFSLVEIGSGNNIVEIAATDTAPSETTKQITITGIDIDGNPVNLPGMTNVTDIVDVTYGMTSFNQHDSRLYAELNGTVDARWMLRGPVLVGVKNLTPASVSLYNADGTTADGMAYYEVNDFTVDGTTGAITGISLDLVFDNPEGVRFDYDLVVMAKINQTPVFTTLPIVEIDAGKTYRYQPEALDPDDDAVTITLVEGPSTMTIDGDNQITWNAPSADVAPLVILRAEDSYGAYTEQEFILSVDLDNSPPYFTSDPIVDAYVGSTYEYPSTAFDDDGDALTFGLGIIDSRIPSADFTIDQTTGLVEWANIDANLIGETVSVEISVNDGAYTTIQPYGILVHADPENQDPIITSVPIEDHTIPLGSTPADGQVSPDGLYLQLGPGDSLTEALSVTLSAQSLSMVDVFLLFDDTGSFSGYVNDVQDAFGTVVTELQDNFPGIDFGFGVGRFEDYYGYGGMPFILNQPIITADTSGFEDAIKSALDRTAPGGGGDLPETLIEGLYQVATGNGFDGDQDGDLYGSGYPGEINTQIYPGDSGDVPPFRSPTEPHDVDFRPEGDVLYPTAGNDGIGGVGFRPGALPIVLVATDYGTVYQHASPVVNDIYGIYENPTTRVTVPTADFHDSSYSSLYLDYRDTTPNDNGATIQDTVDALIGLGALVIGLGADNNPATILKDLAELTGTVTETFQQRPSDNLIAIEAEDFSNERDGIGQSEWNPIIDVNASGGTALESSLGNGVEISDDEKIGARQDYDINFFETGTYYIWTRSKSSILAENAIIFGLDDSTSSYYSEHQVITDNQWEWENKVNNVGYDRTCINITTTGVHTLNLWLLDDNVDVDKIILTQDPSTSPTFLSENNGLGPDETIFSGTCRTLLWGYYHLACIEAEHFTSSYSGFIGADNANWIISSDSTASGESVLEVSSASELDTGDLTIGARRDYYFDIETSVYPYYLWVRARNSDTEARSINLGLDGSLLTESGFTIGVNDNNWTWLRYSSSLDLYSLGIHTLNLWIRENHVEIDKFVLTTDSSSTPAFLSENSGLGPNEAIAVTPLYYPVNGNGQSLANGVKAAINAAIQGITSNIDLVVPSEVASLFNNTTGVVQNVPSGGTATFDVEFTGDGHPHSFDVQFVREGTSIVFGSIPVTINDLYTYEIVAVDEDDDDLQYEFIGDDHGATIQEIDGRVFLLWNPPKITELQTFDFGIRVTDWKNGIWRGGEDTQEWPVTVGVDTTGNQNPYLVNPEPAATTLPDACPNRPYSFTVQAKDDDGDRLFYYLKQAPEGMKIDRLTGEITWQPTTLDRPSRQAQIMVVDNKGGEAVSDLLTINVDYPAIPNRAPEILSTAVEQAIAGKVYRYDVNARDDDRDVLKYYLVAHPEGMVIDEKSGVIVWEPTEADIRDDYSIIVGVMDPYDGVDAQSYYLDVIPANDPPEIKSWPWGPAMVGESWSYQVEATDPNGDTLTYSIDPDYERLGLEFSTTTPGLLTWTPSLDINGHDYPAVGDYPILIYVDDQRGGVEPQGFVLQVRDDVPPQITSEPVYQVIVGDEWTYAITAEDRNGDEIQLTIDQESLNRGIEEPDGFDTIRWTPTVPGIYPIRVTVTDSTGLWSYQEFDLEVLPVTFPSEPPQITSTPPAPTWGDPIPDYVYDMVIEDADSDLSALTFETFVDGSSSNTSVTWDTDHYVFSWTSPTAGDHFVEIKAIDESGNWALQTFPLAIQAPNNLPYFTVSSIPGGEEGILWTCPFTVTDDDGDQVELRLDDATEALGVILDDSTPKLSWTPDTAGTYTITVIADDHQGTGLSYLTITLPVVVAGGTPPDGTHADDELDAPTIHSLPPTWVRAEDTYKYQVVATDDDGGEDGELFYSLDQSPAGMWINEETGLVQWNPKEIAFYDVVLRVTDEDGCYAIQGFKIEVAPEASVQENVPPEIKSDPTGPAVADVPWHYQIFAEDDNDDSLTYDFVTSIMGSIPAGLSINQSTGLVTWTPTEEGTYRIAVKATESATTEQYSDCQYFDLPVLDNAPPHSISIDSGSLVVEVGGSPSIQFTAIDPNGDDLTFSLGDGEGDISFSTNLIANDTWTWNSPAIGNYPFQVVVTDEHGASASKWYTLRVTSTAENDTCPTILDVQRKTIQAGQIFRYQVEVENPNNDPLIFSLKSPPTAEEIMAIDPYTGMISWQTTEADIETSPHVYAVMLDNGRGYSTGRNFLITVVSEASNTGPEISTDPIENGEANNKYLYQPAATDDENDPLSWTLEEGPEKMEIDPLTGLISWEPTIDDVGEYRVVVRVTDVYGLYDEQPYKLTIVGVNRPPQIIPPIPTRIPAGIDFSYPLTGKDPDGDAFTFGYAITADSSGSTTGFTVDPDTGVMSWTNPTADTYNLTLTITDEHGRSSQIGPYTLTVSAENAHPQIKSQPRLYARLGETYEYDIIGYDPEGTNLQYSYSVVSNPFVSSTVNFDSENGVLTIPFPVDADVDKGDHRIRITVSDSGSPSLSCSMEYTLTVLDDLATGELCVKPIANQTVVQRQPLQIPVAAEGDEVLLFSLANAPAGMEIIQTTNTTAVIQWWTDENSVDCNGIEVFVTDRAGIQSDSVYFDVDVVSDTDAPIIVIDSAPDSANLGTTVNIHVLAYDNVAVTGKTLTASINGGSGIPLILEADGWTQMTLNEIGLIELTAWATDAAGNTSQDTHTFRVKDPSDWQPPSVIIHSPAHGEIITGPVNVIGTIDDPDSNNIAEWQLLIGSSSGSFQPFASGTGERTNTQLGVLDSTILANGQYTLRLIATDANGNTSYDDVVVEIDSNLKLGNFNLSFVDLETSVGPIPITITRTYDTLNASNASSLGYGWSFNIAETQAEVNFPPGTPKGWGDKLAFLDGTRVVITLPDGTTEGFTFYGEHYLGLGVNYYAPRFLPDLGVTSTLSAYDARLTKQTSGEYTTYETGELLSYNPEHAAFGDYYLLTTRYGVEYLIVASTGQLYSITDRNGSTITYGGNGIFKDSNQNGYFDSNETGVRFEYTFGQVTALIDPAGRRIEYEYDPVTGDLVSVTNRAGETVQYVYDVETTGRPHFLTQIIDARGVIALQANFDEETGQLTSLTDASDNPTKFGYTQDLGDGQHLKMIIDANNVPTELICDNNGNILRKLQRLSDGGTPDIVGDDVYQITVYQYDDNNNQTHVSVPFTIGDANKYDDYDPALIAWKTVSEFDADGNVKSTTNALGHTTRYTYNEYGQPETISDQLLNTRRNYYDSRGVLYRTEDPEGQITELGHDNFGNTTAIIKVASDGTRITASTSDYDDRSQLTSTTDASNQTAYFVYDDSGNQTVSYYWQDDPDSPTPYMTIITRMDYDGEGRVTRSAQYEVSGVTAGSGYVTITGTGTGENDFYVQGLGLCTYTPFWSSTTEYNAAGQVEKTVDSFGHETWNFYDIRGLLIETLTEAEDTSVVSNGHKWLVSRTVYDDNGQAIYSTDPYAINHFPITNVASYAPSAAVPTYGTHTIYDDLGRAARTEQVRDLSIALTGPDANGFYTSEKSGTQTILSYSETHFDDTGRVLYTVSSDDTGAADGPRTDYYYDAAGRQIAVLGPAVLADINDDGTEDLVRVLTRHFYDDAGRQTRMETNIAVLDSTTDFLGHPDLDTANLNESGMATTYSEYDKVGRQTATISTEIEDPDNAAATTHARTEKVYDSLGRCVVIRENIKQDDPYNHLATNEDNVRETYYEYDNSGRLTAVILPAVEHPNGTTGLVHPRYEYTYDGVGNQTSVSDNIYQTDPTNTATIDDTDARTTEFTYDVYGRQTSRTLPLGVSSGSGFTETSQYNNLGQLELTVDFEGVYTHYLYDAYGRLAAKEYFENAGSWNGGTGTPEETIGYRYDAFGQKQIVDRDGDFDTTTDDQEVSTYNGLGQLITIATPEGIVNYVYNEHTGWLERTWTSKITAPSNEITDTHYTYDVLGRLLTVTLVERNDDTSFPSETTTYRYDLAGNQDKERLANGVVNDYDYDEMNRLVQLKVFEDNDGSIDWIYESGTEGNLIALYEYKLRLDGKRSSVIETDVSEIQTKVDWVYDNLGRLTDEDFDFNYSGTFDPDRSTDYVYDLVGNRQTRTTDLDGDDIPDETIAYDYDANDRLLREAKTATAGNTTTFYQYGGPSNPHTVQTAKTSYDGILTVPAGTKKSETTYDYNYQGRLSQTSVDEDGDGSGAAVVTTYTYDSDGVRISQTVDGTETVYLNDKQNPTGQSQVLEEKDASDAIVKTYTLGHDVISQWDKTPERTLTFLYDGHGSTRGLIDATGQPLSGQVFAYDAFGNRIDTCTSPLTTLLFSGERTDATGLQYLRARYYDPNIGRFNRLDPFAGNTQDPISLHKYLYCHTDPINNMDPSGLCIGGSLGLGMSLSTSIKITTISATTAAGIYHSVGLSAGRGFVATAQLGIGLILAPNKGTALLMGGINVGLEAICQWLSPEYKSDADYWARLFEAFSDGVFDCAFDQWAAGLTITQTHGTIVGKGQVSVAPFAGFFHPFLILMRNGMFEDRMDNEKLIAGMIEASLAYLTNDSGMGLGLESLGLRLPPALRKRVARITSELISQEMIKDIAEEVACQMAESLSPIFDRVREYLSDF